MMLIGLLITHTEAHKLNTKACEIIEIGILKKKPYVLHLGTNTYSLQNTKLTKTRTNTYSLQNTKLTKTRCRPGSSVNIATELRAGRSGMESRWGQDSPPVQTGPGVHPASSKMDTGSFPGVEAARAWG